MTATITRLLGLQVSSPSTDKDVAVGETDTRIHGLEYGHWGITLWARHNAGDYAPCATQFYPYPVSIRGPIDHAETERQAIAHCRALGGEVKGPFFARRVAS